MDEVYRDKYAHDIFLGICFYNTRPYVVQCIAWNTLYIHVFAVKLMAERLESFYSSIIKIDK